MSWGVATQNGVSVSLASIVSLSAGVTEFSPADLFTGGVQGAWYDPSDYSTLFQDSSGTTPVTAVEQPVGLMLDKSQGLVLGSELVTNGDFSSGAGWTLPAGCTISGGVLNVSTVGAGLVETTIAPNAGVRWFVCTWQLVTRSAGDAILRLYSGASNVTVSGFSFQTSPGTFTAYLLTNADPNKAVIQIGGSGLTGTIDNVSVKALPGNHATQATAASRPVLRARYNLLTYSEQFDNAATWGIAGVTRSADVTTAPDGTVTADRITGSAGSNAVIFLNAGYTAVAGNLTLSCYIKAGTADYAVLSLWQGSGTLGVNLWVNVQTGAVGSNSATAGYTFVSGSSTAVGNGWYRVVVTGTVPAGGVYPSVRLVDGDNAFNYTNTVGKTLFIWGADLRTGSSAGTYQRIAAATDYATAGFLPYLAFDGADDFVASSAINFSTTDKMTLCTGITKNSDALRGVFAHLGNTASATFRAEAPDASLGNFAFYTTGSAVIQGSQATSSAPATRVFTGIGDIAADINLLRLNGTQVASNTADQGTGNYSNAAVNVGRRGDGSLFFNGRIYQMVVCGKTLSASELASTEAYVATKTGVTL